MNVMPLLSWDIFINCFHRNLKLAEKETEIRKINDLAKKFNLFFIPFLLQDVALNPELNLSDGIHPNEKGVKIISNTISKKLITILKN